MNRESILKAIDIINRIQKKRRTYWIWVTLDGGVKIRMGNYKVEREDDEGMKLPSGIVYHQLEQKEQEPVFQLVSKKLNTVAFMQGKTLKKNEQIAVVYTEIQKGKTDPIEKMTELAREMKNKLNRYEIEALKEHYQEKVDSAALRMRLEQIIRLQEELDKLIEVSRASYKEAKGKDLYMQVEV